MSHIDDVIQPATPFTNAKSAFIANDMYVKNTVLNISLSTIFPPICVLCISVSTFVFGTPLFIKITVLYIAKPRRSAAAVYIIILSAYGRKFRISVVAVITERAAKMTAETSERTSVIYEIFFLGWFCFMIIHRLSLTFILRKSKNFSQKIGLFCTKLFRSKEFS